MGVAKKGDRNGSPAGADPRVRPFLLRKSGLVGVYLRFDGAEAWDSAICWDISDTRFATSARPVGVK